MTDVPVGTQMYWPVIHDHRPLLTQAKLAGTVNGIRSRRAPVIMKEVTWPEREAAKRHLRNYIFDPLISPRNSTPALMYSSIIGTIGAEYATGSPSLGLPGSADAECEHGRLPGDKCPSPRVYFERRRKWDGSGWIPSGWTQNWPHPHPCGCWPQEAVVRATPDPFADATPRHVRGHRTHDETPEPVSLPRPVVRGGQDASESDGGGGRRRRAAARAEAA